MASGSATSRQNSPHLPQWIVRLVRDALFERDDGVVRDVDVLGAHVRAALRDVAVPDAMRRAQLAGAILGVERMHLERRGVDEEPRSDEFIVQLVLAQDVTHVLAEEALDA